MSPTLTCRVRLVATEGGVECCGCGDTSYYGPEAVVIDIGENECETGFCLCASCADVLRGELGIR